MADFSGTGNGMAGIYNEAFSTDLAADLFVISTQVNQGAVDSMCTTDYVDIPSKPIIHTINLEH